MCLLNVIYTCHFCFIKNEYLSFKKKLASFSFAESSNINEVIRSVLNFLFIFFYDKISQVQKSTKRIKGTKKD